MAGKATVDKHKQASSNCKSKGGEDCSSDVHSESLGDGIICSNPMEPATSMLSTMQRLQLEVLRLKQQNEQLKADSEETSQRLQIKDSELSELKKRTLACGRCSGNHHWQSSSSCHAACSSQSNEASPTDQEQPSDSHRKTKRRISPELIVRYSESTLSNLISHAHFTQLGKGDTFHEYLKIFPESRDAFPQISTNTLGSEKELCMTSSLRKNKAIAVTGEDLKVKSDETASLEINKPSLKHHASANMLVQENEANSASSGLKDACSENMTSRVKSTSKSGNKVDESDRILDEKIPLATVLSEPRAFLHRGSKDLALQHSLESRVSHRNNQEKQKHSQEPCPARNEVPTNCSSYHSHGRHKKEQSTVVDQMKHNVSKDKASKDKASKDKASKDKASKDKPSKDKPSKDKPSKDKPSKDKPSKDKPSKDKPSKDKPSKDRVECRQPLEVVEAKNKQKESTTKLRKSKHEQSMTDDIDRSKALSADSIRPLEKAIASENKLKNSNPSKISHDHKDKLHGSSSRKVAVVGHKDKNKAHRSSSSKAGSTIEHDDKNDVPKSLPDKTTGITNSRKDNFPISSSTNKTGGEKTSKDMMHKTSWKLNDNEKMQALYSTNKSVVGSDKEKDKGHRPLSSRAKLSGNHGVENKDYRIKMNPKLISSKSARASDKDDDRLKVHRSSTCKAAGIGDNHKYNRHKSKINVDNTTNNGQDKASSLHQPNIGEPSRQKVLGEAKDAFLDFKKNRKTKSMTSSPGIETKPALKNHLKEKNATTIAHMDSCIHEVPTNKAPATLNQTDAELNAVKLDKVMPTSEIKLENKVHSSKSTKKHSKINKKEDKAKIIVSEKLKDISHGETSSTAFKTSACKSTKPIIPEVLQMSSHADINGQNILNLSKSVEECNKVEAIMLNPVITLPISKAKHLKENVMESAQNSKLDTSGIDKQKKVFSDVSVESILLQTSEPCGPVVNGDMHATTFKMSKKRPHSGSTVEQNKSQQRLEKFTSNSDGCTNETNTESRANKRRKTRWSAMDNNLKSNKSVSNEKDQSQAHIKTTEKLSQLVPTIKPLQKFTIPKLAVPKVSFDDLQTPSKQGVENNDEIHSSTHVGCNDTPVSVVNKLNVCDILELAKTQAHKNTIAPETVNTASSDTGTLDNLQRSQPSTTVSHPESNNVDSAMISVSSIGIPDLMKVFTTDPKMITNLPNKMAAPAEHLNPLLRKLMGSMNVPLASHTATVVAEVTNTSQSSNGDLQQQPMNTMKSCDVKSSVTAKKGSCAKKKLMIAIPVPKSTRKTYPVAKPTQILSITSDDQHLLHYISLAKRRDREIFIDHRRYQRSEQRRLAAKRLIKETSLAGEAEYGGSAKISRTVCHKIDSNDRQGLSSDQMDELWSMGIDVYNPDMVAAYFKEVNKSSNIVNTNMESSSCTGLPLQPCRNEVNVKVNQEVDHSVSIDPDIVGLEQAAVICANIEDCEAIDNSRNEMEMDYQTSRSDCKNKPTSPAPKVHESGISEESRNQRQRLMELELFGENSLQVSCDGFKEQATVMLGAAGLPFVSCQLVDNSETKPDSGLKREQEFEAVTESVVSTNLTIKDVELPLAASPIANGEKLEHYATKARPDIKSGGDITISKAMDEDAKNTSLHLFIESTATKSAQPDHFKVKSNSAVKSKLNAEGMINSVHVESDTDTKRLPLTTNSIVDQCDVDISSHLKCELAVEALPKLQEPSIHNLKSPLTTTSSTKGTDKMNEDFPINQKGQVAGDVDEPKLNCCNQKPKSSENEELCFSFSGCNEKQLLTFPEPPPCTEIMIHINSAKDSEKKRILEIELFGEDSLQLSCDGFPKSLEVIDDFSQQDMTVTTSKNSTVEEKQEPTPNFNIIDCADGDSELDVGDTEFAIDPSEVKVEIDVSEESLSSWVEEEIPPEIINETIPCNSMRRGSSEINSTIGIASISAKDEYEASNQTESEGDGTVSQMKTRIADKIQDCPFLEENKSDLICSTNTSGKQALKITESNTDLTNKDSNLNDTDKKTVEVVLDKKEGDDITEDSFSAIDESSDGYSEGACAGDEMSEDPETILVDKADKHAKQEKEDTCSLASESGGSSLHCQSTTEDDLDDDLAFNDSLEKTLPLVGKLEVPKESTNKCQESDVDVLEINAGDLSIFDEDSLLPHENGHIQRITPRRSPRKRPCTSTPETSTTPVRTPKKLKMTPKSQHVAKPSQHTMALKKPQSRHMNVESVQNDGNLSEEGELLSDEQNRSSAERGQSHQRYSQNSEGHFGKRRRENKRVSVDTDNRGGGRRYEARHIRRRSPHTDRALSPRPHPRHHLRRPPSPPPGVLNRRPGREEHYSRVHRHLERSDPRCTEPLNRRRR